VVKTPDDFLVGNRQRDGRSGTAHLLRRRDNIVTFLDGLAHRLAKSWMKDGRCMFDLALDAEYSSFLVAEFSEPSQT